MIAQLDDGIIIRNADPTDVVLFRELRLEALKNHPTAFGSDFTESAQKPQAYWEERLKLNSHEQALFFAEHNGELIGMTGIFRSLSKKNMHSADIYGVYVKPGWRGRRISQTLVNACLNWAREQGVVIVKLAVVTDNLSAIRCYKKCGFTTYGREPKALYYDGKYYDEYLMSVDVSNPLQNP
jgi:RimJ/RimL family protein N-acetyltransferase